MTTFKTAYIQGCLPGIAGLGLFALGATQTVDAFETHSIPSGVSVRIVSASIGATEKNEAAVKFTTISTFANRSTTAQRYVRIEDCLAPHMMALWSRNVRAAEKKTLPYFSQIVAADTLGFQVAKEACASVGHRDLNVRAIPPSVSNERLSPSISCDSTMQSALSPKPRAIEERANPRHVLATGFATSFLLNYHAELLALSDVVRAGWANAEGSQWLSYPFSGVGREVYKECLKIRQKNEAQMQLNYPSMFEFSRIVGTACLAMLAYAVCVGISNYRRRRIVAAQGSLFATKHL